MYIFSLLKNDSRVRNKVGFVCGGCSFLNFNIKVAGTLIECTRCDLGEEKEEKKQKKRCCLWLFMK